MMEANARIGVAVAAYFPSFTLSASAGLESTDASRWLTWASRFWSVGAGVTETVFQGGLRGAQTDEARAAYDAAVASYRQTVLEAMQEVEDNLAALRILAEEARAEEDLLVSARQAVTVSMNQYRAGTINYLSVIVAQAAALTNERAAVNIRSRRLVACAVLIKALGGGWEASRLDEAAGKGGPAAPGASAP
jgi:NodT family efflux transporter outer membrane factor (OMF) lipoprotein